MVDFWVRSAQEWVNEHYKDVTGFNTIDEDGFTGWNTMFAFTRALQVELGITALSNNFGSTTYSRLNSQYPTVSSSTDNENIRAIVQCALWCKGYPGGGDFGSWDANTLSGIGSMRSDMGLLANTTITPKIFKSLLTMDAYVQIAGGDGLVRSIQQSLNARYHARKDFYLIPCDGIVSRGVQIGLIYAVQYEIGMKDGVANGHVGPGTRKGLKSAAANVGVGDQDASEYFVHLFQAAMVFNGYFDGPFNGSFTLGLSGDVESFQAFMEIPQTGRADFTTWAALLISTGDPDRPATGFDCSNIVTPAIAAQLGSDGYTCAIRYINGVGGKRIGTGELDTIWSTGMRWVPVYQEYNNKASYFSPEKGKAQGERMVIRLRQLGVKSNNVAFLAVDFDATLDDFYAVVAPHFEAVAQAFSGSTSINYRLGVYGTRNVCTKLRELGYTESSFVSDMSTGYSGNLGVRMPVDWAYDQIQNVRSSSEGGPYPIEIDRDVVSSRAEPLSSSDVKRTPRTNAGSYDEEFFWRISALQYLMERHSNRYTTVHIQNQLVLTWLQKPTFWPDGTPSVVRTAWATIVTPNVWQGLPDGPLLQGITTAQGAFETEAGTTRYLKPVARSRLGATEHWAASTRAYLTHGVDAVGAGLSGGDLASWAMDLATFWRDYEAARLKAPGLALDVRQWTADRLGKDTGTHMDGRDLRADAAAFIVAKRIVDKPTETLEEIVRLVLLAIEDDFGWLPKTFVDERFGSRSDLVAITKQVFTNPWPWVDFPRSYFIGARPPGEIGDDSSKAPPASVRETEIEDIAEGFADAVYSAMEWTTDGLS